MKTIYPILAASLLVGLAGCATTGESSQARATPAMMQTDGAYVARVEQLARTRGIAVTWVNPPEKRVVRHD